MLGAACSVVHLAWRPAPPRQQPVAALAPASGWALVVLSSSVVAGISVTVHPTPSAPLARVTETIAAAPKTVQQSPSTTDRQRPFLSLILPLIQSVRLRLRMPLRFDLSVSDVDYPLWLEIGMNLFGAFVIWLFFFLFFFFFFYQLCVFRSKRSAFIKIYLGER